MKAWEPTNLIEILKTYKSLYFRVRDVVTLSDHLVLTVNSYTQGLPRFASSVLCAETTVTPHILDCSQTRYCLLSSREEIVFLNSFATENQAIFRVKALYKRRNVR